MSRTEARRTLDLWGRLVESAVGAHLLNSSAGTNTEVFYWRERGREVDFVVRVGKQVAAIEVKSGTAKGSLPGMEAFTRAFRPQRKLLVGGDGIPLETFFRTPTLESDTLPLGSLGSYARVSCHLCTLAVGSPSVGI